MQTSGVMRRLLPGAALLACDVLLGWMNDHATDDVQAVALGLIIAGFGFGYWRPRLAWLTVPLLWLAIPISSVVGYATSYHPGRVKPAPLYQTLIALVFPALGAGIGYGVRTILVASRASNSR